MFGAGPPVVARLGQSRISTHLGLLADCEMVSSRRDGKRTFSKLNPNADAVAGVEGLDGFVDAWHERLAKTVAFRAHRGQKRSFRRKLARSGPQKLPATPSTPLIPPEAYACNCARRRRRCRRVAALRSGSTSTRRWVIASMNTVA